MAERPAREIIRRTTVPNVSFKILFTTVKNLTICKTDSVESPTQHSIYDTENSKLGENQAKRLGKFKSRSTCALENSHKLCLGFHQAMKAQGACFIYFTKFLFSDSTKLGLRSKGPQDA